MSEALGRMVPAMSAPDLIVLQQNASLYEVLAYQPVGLVNVTHAAINRANETQALAEATNFLAMASELGAALAIAPEYSIQWQALIDSLHAGIKPPEGCLWALGCESMPLGGIDAIAAQLAGVAGVVSEVPDYSTRTTQEYQNPLAYIFQTARQDGTGSQLVLLIQFKTIPSGDRGNTESRGMFPGNELYVFGQQGGLRLMTLICSDAFGFTDHEIQQYADGLLLLHLQMNNNPKDTQYKRYRDQLFGYQTKTELICLNWARGTKYREPPSAAEHDLVKFTGSAWHRRFGGLDTSDERLASNDFKGLYFTSSHQTKTAVYCFSDKPGVFRISSTKVSHGAHVLAAASYLTGPEMKSFSGWSGDQLTWTEVERVDDGFSKKIESAAPYLDELSEMHRICPIHVDRVANITYGDIENQDWFAAENLTPFALESGVVRRITTDLDEEGEEFRIGRLSAIRTLAQIRVGAFPWPSEVSFLGTTYQISWVRRHPHRNVCNVVGDRKTYATVVCLSATISLEHVEAKERVLRRLLAGPIQETNQDLSDEEERLRKLKHLERGEHLCIIYPQGAQLVPWSASYRTDYMRPATTPDVSVTDASFARRAEAQKGQE